MIILIYDEALGASVPDSKAREYAAHAVLTAEESKMTTPVCVATRAMFDAFRLLVKTGVIKVSDIEVMYRERDKDNFLRQVWGLRIDANGRIEHWPPGMAESHEKIMEQMLDW